MEKELAKRRKMGRRYMELFSLYYYDHFQIEVVGEGAGNKADMNKKAEVKKAEESDKKVCTVFFDRFWAKKKKRSVRNSEKIYFEKWLEKTERFPLSYTPFHRLI
jgi:hypothetical protein